jgi:hypothetical protein
LSCAGNDCDRVFSHLNERALMLTCGLPSFSFKISGVQI